MKKIIYIENEIKKNERVNNILSKYSDYEVVYIEKYTEVFNKRNQNFNLQKTNPSIILANKNKNFLNKIPAKYSIGNKKNFYFSYMYNCPFDCKYCFLQGHYNSANYVIFINYEDYFDEIKKINLKFNNEKITIFSGYDCDSLAYDSYTGFVGQAITFFGKQKNIELELRTKSTLVKPLMKKLEDNIVVAFSFTPRRFSNVYEKGVPSVDKRIKSLKTLVKLGWKIGLRFDPFILYEGWKKDYIELFSNLFKAIPNQLIHSVTYGNLRYPISQFKKIYRQNPTEKLFFNLKKNHSLYEDDHKKKISNFCMQELSKYVSQNIIFQNF